MTRFPHFLTALLLLLCAISSHAQQKNQGNVVVHSDPRLLLLMKPHSREAAIAKQSDAIVAPTNSGSIQSKPEISKEKVPTKTIADKRPEGSKNIAGNPAAKRNTIKSEKVTAEKVPAAEVKPIRKSDEIGSAATVAAGKTNITAARPPVHEGGAAYSGRGYRVQLYNGPDRKKATEIKSEFTRRFPGVHAYLVYVAPAFRVKVGDYRNRADAAAMLKRAKAINSPIMIVPDNISASGF